MNIPQNSDNDFELDPVQEDLQKNGMSPYEAFSFLSCHAEYRRALYLIKQYDEEGANTQDVGDESKDQYLLKVDMANLVIKELKSHLAKQGENMNNFGVAHNGGIEQIIGNIYQTYDKKELYPHIEFKAARLFYSLIKNHPFVDGNKRIASFLLLWFMDMNDMLVTGRDERTITYTIIYALAISVAESNPRDEDVIIRFIRNIIMTYQKSMPE